MDDSDGIFTVVETIIPPVVEVIYPNGGELLTGEVSLTASATDADGTVVNARFLYSVNGGTTWTILGYGTPVSNDNYEYLWNTAVMCSGWRNEWMGPNSQEGSKVTLTELQHAIHCWLDGVPILTGDQYLILVEAIDDDGNGCEDESDNLFRIGYVINLSDLQEIIAAWLLA